jgi:hypothetical protein
MTELTFTPLGAEGHAFVNETLTAGRGLSKALLEREILRTGRAFAFLPRGLNLPPHVEFKHSIGMRSDGSIEAVTKKLETLCKSTDRATIIFEDAEFKKGDPGLARAESQVLYLGDGVYHLARSCSADDIATAISWAESSWWLMGVVAEAQIAPRMANFPNTNLT